MFSKKKRKSDQPKEQIPKEEFNWFGFRKRKKFKPYLGIIYNDCKNVPFIHKDADKSFTEIWK